MKIDIVKFTYILDTGEPDRTMSPHTFESMEYSNNMENRYMIFHFTLVK